MVSRADSRVVVVNAQCGLVCRYQDRQFPVIPVNPTTAQIEGLDAVKEAVSVPKPYVPNHTLTLLLQSALPELPSTSISVILNPKAGLPIVKQLFGHHQDIWPHAIWFQPGAFDEHIQRYLTEQGADDRVVPYGECILVKGDGALASLKGMGGGKSSL